MQEARQWRWPPSLVFGVKPRRKPGTITKLDVLLFDALRLYDDSLCPDCKWPARWVYDPRSALYFQLDPEAPSCVTCEIVEADNEDPESKHEPGVKRRLKTTLFDDDSGVGGG